MESLPISDGNENQIKTPYVLNIPWCVGLRQMTQTELEIAEEIAFLRRLQEDATSFEERLRKICNPGTFFDFVEHRIKTGIQERQAKLPESYFTKTD